MLLASPHSPSPVARQVLLSYFATVSTLSQAYIAVNLSRPLRGTIAPRVLRPFAVRCGAHSAFEPSGGIARQ
ncbi:hypothetical protein PG988_015115 [Apiospora saccharicola]